LFGQHLLGTFVWVTERASVLYKQVKEENWEVAKPDLPSKWSLEWWWWWGWWLWCTYKVITWLGIQ